MKFFLIFLFVSSLTAQARLVEKTVASIGEDMVSLMDLNSFRGQLASGLVPSSLLFQIYPKKKLLKSKKDLLQFMIAQKMISQMAKKRGIESLDFDVKAEIKKIRSSLSLTDFKKKMRQHGLTLETLSRRAQSYRANDVLLSGDALSRISVSDEDIALEFFNRYGKNLFKNFEYEFTSLSFSSDEKGLSVLTQFLKDINTASFEKAAKKRRLSLKTFKLGASDMNPKMHESLKDLSVSQISEPIAIAEQLYLLKLNWKTPVLKHSEQKEKARIHSLLIEKETKKELNKWLKTQKKNFSIKVSFP